MGTAALERDLSSLRVDDERVSHLETELLRARHDAEAAKGEAGVWLIRATSATHAAAALDSRAASAASRAAFATAAAEAASADAALARADAAAARALSLEHARATLSALNDAAEYASRIAELAAEAEECEAAHAAARASCDAALADAAQLRSELASERAARALASARADAAERALDAALEGADGAAAAASAARDADAQAAAIAAEFAASSLEDALKEHAHWHDVAVTFEERYGKATEDMRALKEDAAFDASQAEAKLRELSALAEKRAAALESAAAEHNAAMEKAADAHALELARLAEESQAYDARMAAAMDAHARELSACAEESAASAAAWALERDDLSTQVLRAATEATRCAEAKAADAEARALALAVRAQGLEDALAQHKTQASAALEAGEAAVHAALAQRDRAVRSEHDCVCRAALSEERLGEVAALLVAALEEEEGDVAAAAAGTAQSTLQAGLAILSALSCGPNDAGRAPHTPVQKVAQSSSRLSTPLRVTPPASPARPRLGIQSPPRVAPLTPPPTLTRYASVTLTPAAFRAALDAVAIALATLCERARSAESFRGEMEALHQRALLSAQDAAAARASLASVQSAADVREREVSAALARARSQNEAALRDVEMRAQMEVEALQRDVEAARADAIAAREESSGGAASNAHEVRALEDALAQRDEFLTAARHATHEAHAAEAAALHSLEAALDELATTRSCAAADAAEHRRLMATQAVASDEAVRTANDARVAAEEEAALLRARLADAAAHEARALAHQKEAATSAARAERASVRLKALRSELLKLASDADAALALEVAKRSAVEATAERRRERLAAAEAHSEELAAALELTTSALRVAEARGWILASDARASNARAGAATAAPPIAIDAAPPQLSCSEEDALRQLLDAAGGSGPPVHALSSSPHAADSERRAALTGRLLASRALSPLAPTRRDSLDATAAAEEGVLSPFSQRIAAAAAEEEGAPAAAEGGGGHVATQPCDDETSGITGSPASSRTMTAMMPLPLSSPHTGVATLSSGGRRSARSRK